MAMMLLSIVPNNIYANKMKQLTENKEKNKLLF